MPDRDTRTFTHPSRSGLVYAHSDEKQTGLALGTFLIHYDTGREYIHVGGDQYVEIVDQRAAATRELTTVIKELLTITRENNETLKEIAK